MCGCQLLNSKVHFSFSISSHVEGTGTILEATDTVTGFPPDALLMNSSYDLILDDDLPGFLCVKTHFWDRGIAGAEVVIRRRTIDGDWIWLNSKAIAFVNHPVSGITLEETIIHDVEGAKRMNRITRITAILVQAVEAAWLTESQKAIAGNSEQEQKVDHNINPNFSHPPSVLSDDVQAYQSWMRSISESDEHVSGDVLQRLIQLAAESASNGGTNKADSSGLEYEILEKFIGHRNKTFDPFSIIESVRKGVRLDLGLTRLYPEEVKLITAVLIGMIPVNDVVPAVVEAMKWEGGIKMLASTIKLDCELKHSTDCAPIASNSTLGSPASNVTADHIRMGYITDDHKRMRFPSPQKVQLQPPSPPVSVINLSFTYIGNSGMEMLSEVLHKGTRYLKSLDISFCGIDEKGLVTLAKGLSRRKRNKLPPLCGVILSGNLMSSRAAKEIGSALSSASTDRRKPSRRALRVKKSTGYGTDTSESEDDDDDEVPKKSRSKDSTKTENSADNKGLQVLHVANASLTATALYGLLEGLGINCPVRELNLSSNSFGSTGASVLVTFLETQQRSVKMKAMPFLDRLDMSNNNLGDDGTAKLTKALDSKRSQVHLVDLKLSSNGIGPNGIEIIMNKLLHKNDLLSLSLDKNAIGDQGCQLVAASLQSMRSLSRLNLSFNQIGSRGINSLMRSLMTSDSITYLGLSGNILRVTGSIALGFTLTNHPRLEELDVDNCCLSQAAQCHIVAGIISNRWVPMKRLKGYAVGPPMVAIGALRPYAASLTNEECFRIRKDEQMKTILQWTEENRNLRKSGATIDPDILAAAGLSADADYTQSHFLTPDFVTSINGIHGTPSQNAYFRLLGWLGHIPFDEDELTALQKYFYDSDGGDGDRGSDGYINLKLRGDLLAALDSNVADEFREEFPSLASACHHSVGIDLDKLYSQWDSWEAFRGNESEPPPNENKEAATEKDEARAIRSEGSYSAMEQSENEEDCDYIRTNIDSRISHTESNASMNKIKIKPRITMFPLFERQLEELKAAATEMIEQEEDPIQHDVILTQYAEASLTILRQLRYHCMNSGLDGWRKGGLKRKVLIVDDSLVTRKLVSHAFEKADFIVDTAANGAEGVEKLKASIYDIAFMDIDMPVMNGFEATKKLREWEDVMRPGARQPICALTATYVDDFERHELMKFKEAGLDVMESKPCNISRLFKVVDDVSPMFSDLSISIQRERSDSRLSDRRTPSDRSLQSNDA